MTAIKPNLFQVHGNGLNISNTSIGRDGKPHFSYQHAHQSAQFSGDQIRVVDAEIGTLGTVTIQLTVDSGSTTFSLLVPTIKLSSEHTSSETCRLSGDFQHLADGCCEILQLNYNYDPLDTQV